jgi:hypothetical protein
LRRRREVFRPPDAGIVASGKVDRHELGCAARSGCSKLGGYERVTSQPIVALVRDECGQHRDLRTCFGNRERNVCGTGERRR